MKKSLLKVFMVLALGAVICLPGMALAWVVNFDDLPTPYNSGGALWGTVPSSYVGFTWTGFELQENNSFKSVYANTGDFPSLPNAAYNGGDGYLNVSVDFGAKRNVLDAYFRSWGQNDSFASFSASTVTLTGYNGATPIYTLPVTLSATQMVYTPINFMGVTSITFTSSAEGQYWLMDNFNTVCLPPTLLLLGSSLVGLVGWRRFRKG